MPITTGYKALLEAANSRVETLPVAAAAALIGDDSAVFVDLRDPRELAREGTIPGSFHAPRGMMEFWVDPESPYHKPVFASGKRFIFFCASGWRSALTTDTVKMMGLEPVCHLEGGFSAWKAAGLPIAAVDKHG